ncbi:MAG TPA: Lrp/AsnC family transcriptional regulator [Thermoanaerobaculia bacterium]|nr:Lrp/AsnC family transcriptional regulator [Thermoanaerobaculia bacterium]
MADDLDDLDLAILQFLLKDARIPASQIAEQINLSRPAVSERMDKLERSGVIRGTTAVVAPEALGWSVVAFVSARYTGTMDQKARAAAKAFMERDEIVEAHSVAGDDCYLFKVRTDSIASLNRIVSDLGSPPLSMTTRTTIVMATHCEKVGGITTFGAEIE